MTWQNSSESEAGAVPDGTPPDAGGKSPRPHIPDN